MHFHILETWSARRRPVLPKKRAMSSTCAKFDVVAEQKLELIKLQRSLFLNKLKHEEEEHETKMELLRLKCDKQNRKIVLLKDNRKSI